MLIPLSVVLLFATVVLRELEKFSLINTAGEEELVIYPPDTPLLQHVSENGVDYIEVTANGRPPARFAARKPSDTTRIMVTGESFALGMPYATEAGDTGSIAKWMQAILAWEYPSRRFEIINAATHAQNSYRIRIAVDELVTADPDLVLVLMGNNEGMVPKTPFNEPLHRWVVYRALKKTLFAPPSPEERSYYTPQDRDTRKIATGFRRNVERMISSAHRAHVRIGFGTLPINLTYRGDQPPLNKMPIPYPSDDPFLREGDRLVRNGRPDAAIKSYALSPHQAFAARNIAACLFNLQRYPEAKSFYEVYTELMPLNRIRPSFNRYLRAVCDWRKLFLVDLEQEAERLSPTGIADPVLFLDYCHLNWCGYFLMARAVVRALNRSGIIPRGAGEPLSEPTLRQVIERAGWNEESLPPPFRFPLPVCLDAAAKPS